MKRLFSHGIRRFCTGALNKAHSCWETGLFCFQFPYSFKAGQNYSNSRLPTTNEYILYGDQDPELDEFYAVFRKYWAEAEGNDGYMDPEVLQDTLGSSDSSDALDEATAEGVEVFDSSSAPQESPTPSPVVTIPPTNQDRTSMPPPPVPAKKLVGVLKSDGTPNAEDRAIVQQRIQELKFLGSIGFLLLYVSVFEIHTYVFLMFSMFRCFFDLCFSLGSGWHTRNKQLLHCK